MHRSLRYLPEVLAVAVTLLNAVKPAVVDDTAYLLFARHLAADPLHPYDFELFWYDAPDPAMEILLPPLVPMWLAAGIALFGENLVALKLWLLPFLGLFTRSVWYLLGVFAPRERVRGSVLLAFSPAVLPLVNFMLDIPAVGCGLAATACLVHAQRRDRLGWLFATVILGAAAAQAKYTMIVLPAVWCWYGLTHRYAVRSLVACVVAVLIFAGWEVYVAQQCGESHFWHHLQRQGSAEADSVGLVDKADHWLRLKSGLVLPLVSHLGGLAAGWGLYAASAVGFPRRATHTVVILASIGMLTIIFVPADAIMTVRYPFAGRSIHKIPFLVFVSLGIATLTTLTVITGRLLVRWSMRRGLRRNRAAWFLCGWLAIELAGYFVLTPFPAARRVVMPTVVFAIIACVWVNRVGRVRGTLRPTRAAVGYSLAFGFGLYALDTWDAVAEREAARGAVESILPTPGRIWSQGHWGWQYYIDRAGGQQVVPGVSVLRRGDWLILSVSPGEGSFTRPNRGDNQFKVDKSRTVFVRRLVRDDAISGTTIPSLYGWRYPFVGRYHPRLVVEIHRVTADWVPPPAPVAP